VDEIVDPKENHDEFDGIESDEPELDADDYDRETDPEPERDDQRERSDPRKRYRRFNGIADGRT
jgi:hypothetical protein